MTTRRCLLLHLDSADNRFQVQELIAQKFVLDMATWEGYVLNDDQALPTFLSTDFGTSMLARFPNSRARLGADDSLV